MADNFDFTEGSGKTGAADDVSGVLYPRVKLDLGTDGAAAPALAGAGAVATGVQRITLASDDPAVTLLGTIDADTGAIKIAVELIDNAISGTEMQVDIVASLPAGTNAIGKLAANTGVDIGDVDITSIIPLTGATNLGKARDVAIGANDVGVMALAVRDDTLTTLTPVDGDYVPLRVNSTGALHVTGAGGGTEYTEDVATANPIVGKAIVMERDDVIAGLTPVEGDWAAFRCSAEGALWVQDFNSDAALALLGTIDADTASLAVVGGGTEATALRVTLANDSTGVLSIDDGGGAITVDGTVTANLSAIDNAVLDTIDAVLDTIDADTGAIKLATEIMDDWDATHASAAPADGVQIMGTGYSTALPTDIGADADAARICTDRYGRILRGIMPQNFQATITSADAQSATQVKAKTADRKMYILSLVVSTDTAMNIQFQDDTGPTVLIEQLYLAANGGAHLTWPPEAPLVVNTNEDFDVIASATGNISVTITGYLAP